MAISKDTSLNMLRWFKEVVDEDIDSKIATLSGGGSGQNNVIENISIDGQIQSIGADKTVQLNLSAYAKKTDVTSAISTITGGTTIVSGASYTLQPATTSKLGGVIIGGGLSITDDGTLSVTLETGENNRIENISIDGKNQSIAADKTVKLDLSNYAKQDDLNGAVSSIYALSAALDTVSTGDLNTIENISIDGTNQSITSAKTAVLDLSNYAKKTDIGSGLYMRGSVNTFADLPKNPNVGDLYNIANACVDDNGTSIRAGDNVFYTAEGKWDNMAGFVDTSIFVEKETGKRLSTNDFTDELKTKLEGLENYTLPTASETLKGGVMVGVGLKMSGDTLNVVDHVPFVGATKTKDGQEGLVYAPAAGDNDKFLRGDGYWANIPIDDINFVAAGGDSKAVVADVFTYPPNIPGMLWMDIVQGKHCLKFRYGDYEYIFLPDSSDPETINPASLASFIEGYIYYLNTVPSVENGGMWYTVDDKSGEPTLWIHREGTAYSYDFGYTHDLIAYKGTQEKLYSYLPFKHGMRDLINRIWESSIAEPVIEKTDFDVYALRNMNKSLHNTTETGSGWKYELPTSLGVYTVEFWLSWNEDTNPGYKAATVGEGDTYYEILNLHCYYSGNTCEFKLRVKNTDLLVNNVATVPSGSGNTGKTYKITDLIIGEANILEQKSAKRFHIAITKQIVSGAYILKLFVNGKQIAESGQGSLTSVEIFPYCVGDESEFRGLYIDHFRIWNQVFWDTDFVPPQPEDYIIY